MIDHETIQRELLELKTAVRKQNNVYRREAIAKDAYEESQEEGKVLLDELALHYKDNGEKVAKNEADSRAKSDPKYAEWRKEHQQVRLAYYSARADVSAFESCRDILRSLNKKLEIL